MRKIDLTERPMPEINPAKVCFIIEKSREYLSEDVGIEPDASNPTDDQERIMLTDAANPSIRRELIEFINDLDVDEAAALVALAWIGRGDFQPEEWKIAVERASERAEGPTWKYLLGMELLPDYLEDALSAFGRSCEGLGSADEGWIWLTFSGIAGNCGLARSFRYWSRPGRSIGRTSAAACHARVARERQRAVAIRSESV
jgi:hypothetical protein